MFEREMKQEKNLELRERDLRRARAVEAETKVYNYLGYTSTILYCTVLGMQTKNMVLYVPMLYYFIFFYCIHTTSIVCIL
jgi:hypothetical protein